MNQNERPWRPAPSAIIPAVTTHRPPTKPRTPTLQRCQNRPASHPPKTHNIVGMAAMTMQNIGTNYNHNSIVMVEQCDSLLSLLLAFYINSESLDKHHRGAGKVFHNCFTCITCAAVVVLALSVCVFCNVNVTVHLNNYTAAHAF